MGKILHSAIRGGSILLSSIESKFSEITKEYGIYFKIPNGQIKEKSLNISREYKSCPITPHITVLQIGLYEKTLLKVQKILQGWVKNQKHFRITFEEKIEFGGGGNTFWNIKTNAHLHEFNKELCGLIDPLRDGSPILYGFKNLSYSYIAGHSNFINHLMSCLLYKMVSGIQFGSTKKAI